MANEAILASKISIFNIVIPTRKDGKIFLALSFLQRLSINE